MTEPTLSHRLRLVRTLDATPDRVFRAWTEPRAMKRWMAPGDLVVALAETDVRVGGRYRVHMQAPDGAVHKATGEYREIVPPTRLVFTWRWETGAEEGDTLVTVEFAERAGRTEMTLTHEGFADEAGRANHEAGWTACLANLEAAVAAAEADA